MKRKRFISSLVAGMLACAAALPAEARRDDWHDESPDRATGREAARGDGISLDEAVSRVRHDTGGRVLSAEARERRGAVTYRIKVLMPNGAVRVYNVDARRGGRD